MSEEGPLERVVLEKFMIRHRFQTIKNKFLIQNTQLNYQIDQR